MDALKAVNPLLTLRPLTTHIEHMILQLTKLEDRLGNASSPKPRAKNVLIIRQIIFGK